MCSCCYFPDKASSLDEAETAMLELYCERSQLKDGHSVLDVGCGWGSLSLYIARKCPNSTVTGICNSVTQKAHIEDQCRLNYLLSPLKLRSVNLDLTFIYVLSRELKLDNVKIIVADISTFEMEASYDRIFSIEMFEVCNT